MALFDTLVAAIQKQEGYYPGSLAYRNNNPGNLVLAEQRGASQGEGGFAKFPSYDAGLQALQNQVNLDASRGLTLSQFVSKYEKGEPAPLVQTYLNNMVSATGIHPDQKLSDVLSLDSAPSINTTASTDAPTDAPTEVASSAVSSPASSLFDLSSFGSDVATATTTGDLSSLSSTDAIGILVAGAAALFLVSKMFDRN